MKVIFVTDFEYDKSAVQFVSWKFPSWWCKISYA